MSSYHIEALFSMCLNRFLNVKEVVATFSHDYEPFCGPSFEALLQAPDREQALGSQQAPAPGWAADCRRAPPRTRGTSSEISGWSSWRFRHGRTNLSFISIVFFETAIWKRD